MICSSEIENTRPVCVLPIKCSTLKTIDRYNWYLIRILVYIGFVGAIRLFYLSGSALNAGYSLNNLNIFTAGYFETVLFTIGVIIDLMKYIEYIGYAYYSIIKHIPRFECIKDSLLLTNTELGKDTRLYLNRMEQAELCVFLAETRDHR